ncbi:hypothetical protein BH11BAC2_BH11BAC2_10170 [soil metagenome]
MREQIRKMMHFLAGVICILHSFSKMESGQNSTWFYLFCGILMFTWAFFQEKMEKSMQKVAGSFYWIEGVVIGFIALEYFSAHKKFIPWIYLLIGSAYFFIGYQVMYQKIRKK